MSKSPFNLASRLGKPNLILLDEQFFFASLYNNQWKRRFCMSFNVIFNKGYDSSYMLLPLEKTYNGLTVKAQDSKINQNCLSKDILNDLKQADTDKNNVLTLDELKNSDIKSEFISKLEIAMQNFNSNANKDYSKNIFEIDV